MPINASADSQHKPNKTNRKENARCGQQTKRKFEVKDKQTNNRNSNQNFLSVLDLDLDEPGNANPFSAASTLTLNLARCFQPLL